MAMSPTMVSILTVWAVTIAQLLHKEEALSSVLTFKKKKKKAKYSNNMEGIGWKGPGRQLPPGLTARPV